jgi:soluble lytic murein transglycosylase-like protein
MEEGFVKLKLSALTALHGFEDSIRWQLTRDGLLIEGELAPRGTGGPPRTVRRIWEAFGDHIAGAAREFDVPVELIISTIATESRGNPNAERSEPGFISYEETPHRVSLGLMQTLISTARQALKDKSIDAEALRDPGTSIRAGTAYIAQQRKVTDYDPPNVACAYNAGGVYLQTGATNRWRMRQFPIGTGAHADRFVAWFNDCFIFFEDPAAAPRPSFVRALAAADPEV